MFQTKDDINLKSIIMEASKRPAENGSNGDSTDAKKAKLDPDCGALLFCGTTEWQNVRKNSSFLEFSSNIFAGTEARQAEGGQLPLQEQCT